jgi:hypothetical protein
VVYCNANFLEESDAEKLETAVKTDVHSFRRVRRHASCSAGALCSRCGALMCNIQMSTFVKSSWTPWIAVIFQNIASVDLDLFCCQHRSSLASWRFCSCVTQLNTTVLFRQVWFAYIYGHKNKTVKRSHHWNSGCWYRLQITCWCYWYWRWIRRRRRRSGQQQPQAETNSRELPTWGLFQGRHTNIHPFVSSAKGVKKREAPHINKASRELALLMLSFCGKLSSADGTDQPVLWTARIQTSWT